MKLFFKYLKSFISEHWDLKLYLLFFAYTAILITINYSIDFEDHYLAGTLHKPYAVFAYAATHAVGYYGMLFILLFYRKDFTPVKSYEFWLKTLIVFLAIGLDRTLRFYNLFTDLPYSERIYLHRNIKNIIWVLTFIIPALFLYFIWDRKHDKNFYGLGFKNVKFKTYLSIFWVVIPLTFAASFLPDFLKQYPIYKESYGIHFDREGIMPKWLTTAIFEVCYLSDFISIEFMFRGVLVISMVRMLGKDAIIPMATFYAVLHFGKPVGETISSMFGGYILGVITYYGRNIWGGVFLHMGLAFFMEFFAFMQKYLL